MTLVVAAALVLGGILLLSAINDWSIRETVQRILSGTASDSAAAATA